LREATRARRGPGDVALLQSAQGDRWTIDGQHLAQSPAGLDARTSTRRAARDGAIVAVMTSRCAWSRFGYMVY
jgi:hypothetical protein